MPTSNKDIKRVAVCWIVIARHCIKWPYSQRVPMKDIELRAISKYNNSKLSLGNSSQQKTIFSSKKTRNYFSKTS